MSNSFFISFRTLIVFIIFLCVFISVFFIPMFPDEFVPILAIRIYYI